MIAAIEWIPAGRANPTPSKYEYSRAEQEFLAQVQAGAGELAKEAEGNGDDAATNGDDDDVKKNAEEWEDMEGDDDDEEEGYVKKPVELPKVDPSSLPADLRMDDYSDDDEDQDKNVGGLLVGKVCCVPTNL